jgi:8-oxo-dGTP pyrophosphatase MutT (NUDIX family)
MTRSSSLFVDDDALLAPGDAVAAILVTPDEQFLLQLRDNSPGIFFPDHWGCFGGALEQSDASPRDGLRRELNEEIGIDFPLSSLHEFTAFTFDLSFAGIGVMSRTYFLGHVTPDQVSTLHLGEGSAFKLFDARTALAETRLVPYDGFALWLYHARGRLRPSEMMHG